MNTLELHTEIGKFLAYLPSEKWRERIINTSRKEGMELDEILSFVQDKVERYLHSIEVVNTFCIDFNIPLPEGL